MKQCGMNTVTEMSVVLGMHLKAQTTNLKLDNQRGFLEMVTTQLCGTTQKNEVEKGTRKGKHRNRIKAREVKECCEDTFII